MSRNKRRQQMENQEPNQVETSSEAEPTGFEGLGEPVVILPQRAPVPSVLTDEDLRVLFANHDVKPDLHVGIIVPAVLTDSIADTRPLERHLSRYKIPYNRFSASLATPALVLLLRRCCMVVNTTPDVLVDRKILASGRFILRLSGEESPCPYIKVADPRNLNHVIIEAKRQISKSFIPKAIAKYAIVDSNI